MKALLSERKQRRLLQDLLHARHDLLGLVKEHHLSPGTLARWMDDPGTQRLLGALCRLADYQTQLLLSRYRWLAAGRLIKLATGSEEDGPAVSSDVARRACVDLLRLDLKRTQAESGPESGGEEPGAVAAMRKALFNGLEEAGVGPRAADDGPGGEGEEEDGESDGEEERGEDGRESW